jgi:hypothetical protein
LSTHSAQKRKERILLQIPGKFGKIVASAFFCLLLAFLQKRSWEDLINVKDVKKVSYDFQLCQEMIAF